MKTGPSLPQKFPFCRTRSSEATCAACIVAFAAGHSTELAYDWPDDGSGRTRFEPQRKELNIHFSLYTFNYHTSTHTQSISQNCVACRDLPLNFSSVAGSITMCDASLLIVADSYILSRPTPCCYCCCCSSSVCCAGRGHQLRKPAVFERTSAIDFFFSPTSTARVNAIATFRSGLVAHPEMHTS